MTDEWRQGIEDLRSGHYWEAHEAWEEIWKDLPESPAREAMQALIQFAAASYKIEQCRKGRPAEAMQRGIEGLIERARGHLERGEELAGRDAVWDVDALRSAFDQLDQLLEHWRDGAELSQIEAEIHHLATRLAEQLDNCDAPVDK